MAEGPIVLVTGATGFVGRYLVSQLREQMPNADIVEAGLACAKSKTLHVDITDANAVDAMIEGVVPDIVFHLCGFASVAQSHHGQEKCWRVNLGGSLNLVSALARYSPRSAMLYVSTSEVYGRSFEQGVADETTQPLPGNPYARSKSAAEQLLCDVFPSTGKLIIARPFNHTGAGQDTRFVVPSFAEQLVELERRGGGDLYVGNLDVEREFLDVRDVVSAYIALARERGGFPSNSIFNVATSRPLLIKDVLQQMCDLVDAEISVRTDPARVRSNEIASASGCSAKIRSATGWEPTIPLRETLLDVVNYMRAKARAAASPSSEPIR